MSDPDTTRSAPGPGLGAASRLLGAFPGEQARAVVNGLFGDLLDERGSSLATPMTVRLGDTVLPLDRLHEVLADPGVSVGPRLCVLVHGLMSTESIWAFRDDPTCTYGTLLADDHGLTVLSVRYNTGRHVSENGRELSHLLELLVRAWPTRVSEIDLIGHSMGGLVVRSACHAARRTWPVASRLPFGRRWTNRLRRVVLIGSPHTGAGLEALVNSASAALWALPVPAARLVALGLDRRSAGIKDLRFGAIVDEDWLEHDPAARRRPHPHRPLRLPGVRHLLVAGSVAADHEHPLAAWLGDALVTSSSATGRSDEVDLFPGATIRTFPGVTHNDLAHHSAVHEAIADWW